MLKFVRIKCPLCDHLMVTELAGSTFTIENKESKYYKCKCPCCDEDILVSYETKDVVMFFEVEDKIESESLVLR